MDLEERGETQEAPETGKHGEASEKHYVCKMIILTELGFTDTKAEQTIRWRHECS